MGCSGISFSHSTDDGYKPVAGNPVPTNFKIINHYEEKDACALQVVYPDCKNYEGNKILVYTGHTYESLKNMKSLDPHFSKNGVHPFARFEPTMAGWSAAVSLVNVFSIY